MKRMKRHMARSKPKDSSEVANVPISETAAPAAAHRSKAFRPMIKICQSKDSGAKVAYGLKAHTAAPASEDKSKMPHAQVSAADIKLIYTHVLVYGIAW